METDISIMIDIKTYNAIQRIAKNECGTFSGMCNYILSEFVKKYDKTERLFMDEFAEDIQIHQTKEIL